MLLELRDLVLEVEFLEELFDIVGGEPGLFFLVLFGVVDEGVRLVVLLEVILDPLGGLAD